MSSRNIRITIPLGGAGAYTRFTKVTSGGNTPKALRRLGIFTENGYKASISHIHNSTCIYSWKKGGPQRAGSADDIGAAPVFDSCPQPAWIDVLPRLLGKWRESEFNLGVTLGEGKESISLMTDRLRSVSSAALAISRRDLGGTLRHLGKVPKSHRRRAQKHLDTGDVSSAFLELNLGWGPLVNDCYALAGMVSVDPTSIVLTTSKTLKVLSAKATGGGIPASRVQVRKNNRTRYVKITVTSQPSMAERLGLKNVAGIVWGLTTCSFVADYVLPISATIDSLYALAAMPVSKCVVTDVYRTESITPLFPGDFFAGVHILNPAEYRHKATEMVRTVSDGLPSAMSVLNEIPLRTKSWVDPNLRQLSVVAALTHSRLKNLDRLSKLAKVANKTPTPSRVYASADFTNVSHPLR